MGHIIIILVLIGMMYLLHFQSKRNVDKASIGQSIQEDVPCKVTNASAQPTKSDILFIGVGSAGTNIVKRFREENIPNSKYLVVGDNFCQQKVAGTDIPCINLVSDTDWENRYYTSEDLVSMVEEKKELIREVIKERLEL